MRRLPFLFYYYIVTNLYNLNMTTENTTTPSTFDSLIDLTNEIEIKIAEENGVVETPTPSEVEVNVEEDPTANLETTNNIPEVNKDLNLDLFANITFDEPKAPELLSQKYLKEWDITWDDLQGQNQILHDLLKQIDQLQQEKYETEKTAYDLKVIPEVKAAVVSKQVAQYVSENSDAWAAEFTSDVLAPEEIKLLNKLNKTQQKELETYVDSLVPDYILDRKLKGKTIYNPFVVFKHEIKTKINEITAPIVAKQNNNQPKTPELSLDQKKRMIAPTGGSSATDVPIPSKSVPTSRLQTFIDLGV